MNFSTPIYDLIKIFLRIHEKNIIVPMICERFYFKMFTCRDTRDDGSHRGPPGAKASFTDELDARGTFNKEEARKEFSRMHRTELEGRGLSVHKVGEILDRAEKRGKLTRKNFKAGVIHYKDFLGKQSPILL